MSERSSADVVVYVAPGSSSPSSSCSAAWLLRRGDEPTKLTPRRVRRRRSADGEVERRPRSTTATHEITGELDRRHEVRGHVPRRVRRRADRPSCSTPSADVDVEVDQQERAALARPCSSTSCPIVLLIGALPLLHELDAGRRQPGHAVRQGQGQAGRPRTSPRSPSPTSPAADEAVEELQEIKEFLETPGQVPGHGRQDPQGRAALRPARHRQDAAGPGRGRRGRRAVLLDLRLRLRRDVRRRRRQPGARPVRAGQGSGAGHHLRRRDRRRRPPPRRRPRRRPRRAGADAQPAPRRDGRLRRQDRRHPHRRHQPARHPRPRAAAPRPLRPPDRRRPARPRGPQGHPRRPRQGQAARPTTSTSTSSPAAPPASPAPTSPTS